MGPIEIQTPRGRVGLIFWVPTVTVVKIIHYRVGLIFQVPRVMCAKRWRFSTFNLEIKKRYTRDKFSCNCVWYHTVTFLKRKVMKYQR